MARTASVSLNGDPLWYKDAIIYELHVRAFFDQNNDGIGDFRGLSEKLDYLQDLGVTAIWLLPFSPSPWRDDGYDIADYNDVHPAYGSLRDFQHFLREAHRRNLRVITEVVINHTSDQHPWFQRARRAPKGSKWRDFYVWSDTPDKYKEARIIFKDFETSNWTWDALAGAYFWHRFYSHQPDLNFDSPHVRQAVKDVVDFWFDMGVDAFRLDAIPYLFEREDTNCENLPETHAFLKELRAHVDSKHPNRMLLAEANQWPDDSIQYFGAGDECHMAFHFPVMPRLFMATRMEDRYPIIEILQQTPAIPANCQWAMFLRNHDELTLEMVTDEERDYMYRVYAQDRQMRINLGIRRRLAPLLENDRRKVELLNALLFSLPGTPVIYYGDEIGMGDNIYLGDRNGVRTPMQWSADRNSGFSRANPQRLYLPITFDPEYNYESVNVEAQSNNTNSLLWWMKRTISQRKLSKAFGRGTIEFLHPENRKVLVFYRSYEDEHILVVANLSRFSQHVNVDLCRMKDYVPVEMFGGTRFPVIGDSPYAITLGSYGYYWFQLQPRRNRQDAIEVAGVQRPVPVFDVDSLTRIFEEPNATRLMSRLPEFLQTRRWFRSKTRTIRKVSARDVIPMSDIESFLVLVRVDYTDGEPEDYVLPVALARGDEAARIESQLGGSLVSRLRAPDGSEALLYGALFKNEFADALLGAIARRRKFRGRSGELVANHTRSFRSVYGGRHPNLEAHVSKAEQSNSSIIYGERFILKLFRKLESGTHPDVEISGFLTESGYLNTPPLTGTIEYRPHSGEVQTLAILQGFVRNEGDAWSYTLDSLGQFFESALTGGVEPELPPAGQRHALDLMNQKISEQACHLIGTYVASATLLGKRTAEMHKALDAPAGGPDFAPEPYTDHYRMGLYHGFISQANRMFELLARQAPSLEGQAGSEARALLDAQNNIRDRFRSMRDTRIQTTRIRHHGDYHLGQVLFTGKDFMIIDFEGEPARPLGERRLKRSPLRDVAGMIRSFHYASYASLFGAVPGLTPRPETAALVEAWAQWWYTWVSAIFLKGYMDVAGKSGFIPQSPDQLRTLLDVFVLEKAIYEVTYELNNRPAWVRIPMRGIFDLLT